MIRVLIADDHTPFIEGLQALISTAEDIAIAGTAPDGRKALNLIREVKPDVAVLDIYMPELTGLEVIESLRGSGISTKFIVVTMHGSPAMAGKVMELEASGYVLKENAFRDLIPAIRTVACGGAFMTPSAEDGLSENNSNGSPAPLLSPRETEILSLIAQGCSNRQIAEKLFVKSCKEAYLNSAPVLL